MSGYIAALVRHGEYHQLPDVPSAQHPFALTDEGRGQAENAANILFETFDEMDRMGSKGSSNAAS